MTSLPQLVGLIGRKGAGKDTAAEVLLSVGYENVKFAGALKDMIRSLLAYQGVEEEVIERMVEGDLKEVPTPYLAGRTPRYAMQTLGTEWGRDQIADDLWVGTAIRRAGNFDKVVITDVRFPNEKTAVDEAGGVCVGITADWITATEGEHASEALIDEIIEGLSDSNKIINRKAAPGLTREAIEEFHRRFLKLIGSL